MVPVKSIMTKNVVSVSADTLIFDALNLLTKHKISGLPVVDQDKRLVGILSEKDVLTLLFDHNVGVNARVADYMSDAIISFSEDDDVINVCKFFVKHSIRRVPIVKDGKLAGVVSRRDIVQLIIEMRNRISSYRVT